MKRLFLLTSIVCLACSVLGAPGEYTVFTSPSGQIIADAGIAGAEASPSARMRVRLVFKTATKKRIGEIWTGLAQRWAATWSNNDVFLVCGINTEMDGKPLEFYAFDFTKNGIDGRRSPTELERAKVFEVYRSKYPVNLKTPNQSSEPTSASVTPPAGQEARPR